MIGSFKTISNHCFYNYISYLSRLLVLLPLGLASLPASSFAEETNVFVMAGTDGYGVTDCLREGGSCGQIVADAWCESHGFQKAIAFGLADDVTASIANAETRAKLEQSAILIRCAR
ncbi:MAG: hypothetical protein EBY21_04865 [Alphaproteobacteria bacterium]|nr:hypothetical protein [Alphaproteobacteria bacterium]